MLWKMCASISEWIFWCVAYLSNKTGKSSAMFSVRLGNCHQLHYLALFLKMSFFRPFGFFIQMFGSGEKLINSISHKNFAEEWKNYS